MYSYDLLKKPSSRGKVGIARPSRGLSAGEGMHCPVDGTLRPHLSWAIPAESADDDTLCPSDGTLLPRY
ncbi:hypothetical protein WN944_018498 [Citrus x changshan-huyou]|uniref:Uncharacterized protein n=1 Tax=Citrus x changshan-huyou TaxID=2935761 RepID=A0AAP0LWF9_9ROSI